MKENRNCLTELTVVESDHVKHIWKVFNYNEFLKY